MAGRSKTCTKCGVTLPFKKEFWHKDSSEDDGFHVHCKSCRNIPKEEQDTEHLDELTAAAEEAEKLDRAIAKVVDKKIKAKLKQAELLQLKFLEDMESEASANSGSKVPHMSEQYQRMSEAFGGARGIAKFTLLEFLSAQPGSQIRQRILNSIVNLGVQVSNDGSATKPLELMSDEEIAEMVEATARRVVKITHEVSDA